MMDELEKAAYGAVRPLFEPLIEFQPACAAVLDGVYPGRVFADGGSSCGERPRTAFLSTFLDPGAAWCFLAGHPDDGDFNRALNRAIFERRVFDQEEVYSLLLTCHPEAWQGSLAAVCQPRQPVPMPRRHYLCQGIDLNWRELLPAGFSLHPLDESLLAPSTSWHTLHVPDGVRDTLQRWQLAGERLQDFGFVLIHQAAVVAWATVDFVSGRAGDVGFFTVEGYRRRGLATVAAAATVEDAFARGLSHVHWTVSEDNVGSIRLAEKLGCRWERDYTLYLLAFDEAQGLAQLAYSHLQAGRYEQALEAYADFGRLNPDPPLWYYHELARAWAGLGDGERALQLLERAVDRGWNSAGETAAAREFADLRGTPEWDGALRVLLARMAS